VSATIAAAPDRPAAAPRYLLILTVALPDLVESNALTALTVTELGDGNELGAVYKPPELITPTVEFPPCTPLTRHVTLRSVVFWTVA
jgi:hypothetical protein